MSIMRATALALLLYLLSCLSLISPVSTWASSLQGQVQAPCRVEPRKDLVFLYGVNLTYMNRGEEPVELSDADLAFPVFMNSSWQKARLIWTSPPVEKVAVDADGNLWAVLSVEDRTLEPGENLTLSVRFEITTRPRDPPAISVQKAGDLGKVPWLLRREYCRRAACWLTDDPALVSLAHELAGNKTNVLEIIAAFVAWIHKEVAYESHEIPLYPNETYKGRRGDCDDQANLFITLCRIVGVPAYLQVGCIYLPEPMPRHALAWEGHYELSAFCVGWHGWAVAYVPPWGWLPVDLTASAGLEEDPLNAIKTAIAWSQFTIIAVEIRTVDYVGATRASREEVVNSGLYIREEEALRLVREEVSTSYMQELMRKLATYLLLTMAVLGGTALAVGVFLARRRKRPRQLIPGWPAIAGPSA